MTEFNYSATCEGLIVHKAMDLKVYFQNLTKGCYSDARDDTAAVLITTVDANTS